MSFDNKRTCKYNMTPCTIHTIHKYLLSLHNEHQEAQLQMNNFNRFKFTWGFCVWYQCCTSHLLTYQFFVIFPISLIILYRAAPPFSACAARPSVTHPSPNAKMVVIKKLFAAVFIFFHFHILKSPAVRTFYDFSLHDF